MFKNIKKELQNIDLFDNYGKVTNILGNMVESIGPAAKLGDICYIKTSEGDVVCEVVGFNGDKLSLMAYDEIYGISNGDKVYTTKQPLNVKVGPELRGKILDGLGNTIDDSIVTAKIRRKINVKPVSALNKKIIDKQLEIGVKAIDSMIPIGAGQRVGIFAGSGVGKSTLLGQIARYSKADINVIALIGERGRELQEFIKHELGDEGLKRSVVVVATSDQPALMKIKAAFTATTIAEYFRDQGLNVMLMMDSVTRLAQGQREVGIATGEKVAQRGYTPSVFALIPKLLERAGTSENGTITGIYTVLVDADDMNEPIADCVRGILDGHIVLDRKLAHAGHFPAIDVLSSISRVTNNILTKDEIKEMNSFRELLQMYKNVEDLLNIGAYQKGVNFKTDRAIEKNPECVEFLKQDKDEYFSISETRDKLQMVLM